MEGAEDAQITLGLKEETDYEVFVQGEAVGTMNTGVSGKLSLSIELSGADFVEVKIVEA